MEMREMAEGIRRGFEAASWDAGAPIGKEDAERLEMAVRGEAGRFTITTHKSVLVLDDPVFELCDSDSTCVTWVRKIPTPEQAAVLLDRYGIPAEEADTVDPATPPSRPLYRRKRIGNRSEAVRKGLSVVLCGANTDPNSLLP